MAETRLQEWKTSKLPFLGHPLCSWLHSCACFSLIMWSPGPRCTAVEANFGGRQGDRGQARPLARLCRPPTPPPTDLLDNPEVDLALAACRWPAPALGKLFSPLQLLLYLQVLLLLLLLLLYEHEVPSLQCPSCRPCEEQWESWGNFRDRALQELLNYCMTFTNEQRDKKMLFLALLYVIFSFKYKRKYLIKYFTNCKLYPKSLKLLWCYNLDFNDWNVSIDCYWLSVKWEFQCQFESQWMKSFLFFAFLSFIFMFFLSFLSFCLCLLSLYLYFCWSGQVSISLWSIVRKVKIFNITPWVTDIVLLK